MTNPFCTVLREPKGGPDAVLAGYAAETALLTRAANILSVRGITCRIVVLPDGATIADVPEKERAALFPEHIPVSGFSAFGSNGAASAEQLANLVIGVRPA